MKGNIKVSIIIPVYNVEKYIRQCLESVINQTYKNLEIMVVNDGTRDNSMKIVEEYLSDERIRIINKENGGISSARNRGIEEATGEYFLFVDSDDWIEEYAIEYFIRNLTNEDVIGANFSIYDEEKSEKYEKKLNIEYEKIKFGEYFLNDGYEIVVWNKLYKKEFILKNNIKFIENIIHEDVNFIFKTYMKSPIVKYLEKSTYIYRTNRKDSIMYKVKRKKELSTASLNKIIYDLEELLEDNKIEKNFIKDRIRLKILSLKIGALKTEDKKLLANEKFNLDNLIFEISRNNYLEEEKEIIRKEFQAIILQREYTKFTISNLLLWKYKILNLNILRKILSRKLKKIMKGEV